MLDLNALHLFVTVAEQGSFSQAGRIGHISQPAVSQAIQALERQLGVKLFARTGKSVRLTEHGFALLPMARELLTSAHRLEQTMISLHDEVVGEMTIGCSTTSGKYILPGLIAQFRKKYPHVRVNVDVTSRHTVFEKLMHGDLALGVSSKAIDNPDLEYQSFYKDTVILIVPADHPWAKFRQVHPDDLLDEPLILREESAGTREVLMEGLHQHDIHLDMLNISMVLGNAEAIEMAVEEGLGVAFISRLAASRGLALGRVVEVETLGMSLHRNIYLIHHRNKTLPRAHAEFWGFVRESRSEIQKRLRTG